MVTSVEVDGVMALVEIEAGPHRVIAAVTRDSVEELGLAPGVPATAAVKATSVMVERGASDAPRAARARWPRWRSRCPRAATTTAATPAATPSRG